MWFFAPFLYLSLSSIQHTILRTRLNLVNLAFNSLSVGMHCRCCHSIKVCSYTRYVDDMQPNLTRWLDRLSASPFSIKVDHESKQLDILFLPSINVLGKNAFVKRLSLWTFVAFCLSSAACWTVLECTCEHCSNDIVNALLIFFFYYRRICIW